MVSVLISYFVTRFGKAFGSNENIMSILFQLNISKTFNPLIPGGNKKVAHT